MTQEENEFSHLTVKQYSTNALNADQGRDDRSIVFPLLGLFGETGSLLSEVKKKQRDHASYTGYASAVVEELGDVLWYLNALAARHGFSLEEFFVPAATPDDCNTDDQQGPITFAQLQSATIIQPVEPTAKFEDTLLRLASEVGLLMSDQVNTQMESKSALRSRLGTVADCLLKAADQAGVTLEAAAVKNQIKISDRWPRDRIYPEPLDLESVAQEQLPREFSVDIFERTVNGQTYVYQQCKGINIGDRLTDNAVERDDYRFHDVFHLAYVAVLTWSPVTRSLLRVKRKSMPEIDDAEDGARAKLIEEGVTTWIFGQAKHLDFFSNTKTGDLPFGLLKQVRGFVTGYEAENCPLWLWEEAILQGYSAFRFLKEHRRARIHIDMTSRQLTVEKLP